MFKKRDNSVDIAGVVERNTKMPIEDFLKDVRLPFIDGIKRAVNFVKEYINNNPDCDITIVGDYDSDGINATAIMYWVFAKLGLTKHLKIRIPKRISEGYGLNPKIISEISSGLLITVDNGIAAHEAIQMAKDKGLAVIVTDHHLPPKDENQKDILPNADIIVDPHIDGDKSEFHDYCGAAIAYAFAREMFPEANLYPLLVLASIATVTDVMPLVGANRTLVKDGLVCINKQKNVPGLNTLIQEMGLSHIDEYNYGFDIGPAFNAPGRLYDEGAKKVLELLTAKRDDRSMPYRARNLIATNNVRKGKVREAMAVAESLVTSERPICIYDSSFEEGIVGIIAGKLTEKYNTPSVVFTDGSNGGMKGSARSTANIHLKNRLDAMKNDGMFGYGGHAGAAGIKLFNAKDFEAFKKEFVKTVGTEKIVATDIMYDLELAENDIGLAIKELKTYAPYGEGNPKPVFHMTVKIPQNEYRVIGDGTHFSVRMNQYTMMGFGLVEKYEACGRPEEIEIVATLSENWFNGRCSNKVEIIDFEPA